MMRKQFFALLLGFILVFSNAAAVSAQALPPDIADIDLNGTVIIIHTNDSHGRIVYAEGRFGFCRVAGLRNELEGLGAAVLLFDSGDTLHGLPIVNLSQGEDIVPIMNAVAFDAMAPGNHDFNYGFDHLMELAEAMTFPVLAANVVFADTGMAAFDEHVIIERGGLTFGVFGLATPETPISTNPRNVEMLTFTNPLEAAARQVGLLQEAGVDYVVALAHIGIEGELTSDLIASEVDGIDILLDGHSHTAIAHSVPVDDDISLLPHPGTVLASTSGHMREIGVIIIADGQITSTLISADVDIPPDETVEGMINALVAEQEIMLAEVIGHTPVDLDGARGHVRTRETNLGNLAADAILAAAGTDIAFTNGGDIRDSIAAGPITRGDLITVFPFGGHIVTKEISGAALLEALENGVSEYPEESGGFLHVAGLSFTFDPERAVGERVLGAYVNGSPVEPTATYTLATNDFLADGGDGYTMLLNYPITGHFGTMEEIMTVYIQGNPEFPEVEGRVSLAEDSQQQPDAPAEDSQQQPDAPAEDSQQQPDAPAYQAELYVVVRGDSLYRIARNQLGDSSRWPEIFALNRDRIRNPHLILIGWELRLPAA